MCTVTHEQDCIVTVQAVLSNTNQTALLSRKQKSPNQAHQHGRTDLHKHEAGVLQRASGEQVDCPLGGGNVQQPEHTPIQPAHNPPTFGMAVPPIPCAILNHLWHKSTYTTAYMYCQLTAVSNKHFLSQKTICIDNMAASRCYILSGARI